MPHSSGGSSHSSGSHSHSHSSGGSSHSSHYSGGSSSTSNYSSNVYFDTHKSGTSAYVYYRHNKPHYFYAYQPYDASSTIISSILAILFVLTFVWSFSIMALSGIRYPTPIDAPSNNEIIIADFANIISDNDELLLKENLEEFRDKTGVVPCIVTDTNEYWQEYYSELETYAYEYYVTNFEDEKHWLIMYTTDSDEDFDNWYFEGMIGDDTSKIIVPELEDLFTKNLDKYLRQSNKLSFTEAVSKAFEDVEDGTHQLYINKSIVIPYLIIMIIPIILILVIIKNILKAINMEKSFICPSIKEANEEVKCQYCGRKYIKNIHSSCPYCAAPPPDEDASIGDYAYEYHRQPDFDAATCFVNSIMLFFMFLIGIGPIPEILKYDYIKYIAVPVNILLVLLGAYMAFRPLIINKIVNIFGEGQYAYIAKSEIVCKQDNYIELFLELRNHKKIRLGKNDYKRAYLNCEGAQVYVKSFKNFYIIQET